jgi:hypothetical protein
VLKGIEDIQKGRGIIIIYWRTLANMEKRVKWQELITFGL